MGKTKRRCAFKECTVTNLTQGVSLHPFVKPWKDEAKCVRWIKCSGRKDLTLDMITKETYVCTPHFNICNRLCTGSTLCPDGNQLNLMKADTCTSTPMATAMETIPINSSPLMSVSTYSPTNSSSSLKLRDSNKNCLAPKCDPTASRTIPCSPESTFDICDEELGVCPLPESPNKKRRLDEDVMFSISKNHLKEPSTESKTRNKRAVRAVSETSPKTNVEVPQFPNFKTPHKTPSILELSTPLHSPKVDSRSSIFTDASPRKSVHSTPTRRKLYVANTPMKRAAQIVKKAARIGAQRACDIPAQEHSQAGVTMVTHGTQVDHCMSAKMSYEQCVHQPEFKYFCGLTPEHFEHLYTFIGGDAKCKYLKYTEKMSTPKVQQHSKKNKLSLRCKLFLTLVRLRRGFQEEELAYFFGVSHATVSKVIRSWVQLLYLELKRLSPFMFPSAAEQQLNKPACFHHFKNVRVVVDSFSVKLQSASDFRQQGNLYAQYYASSCVKFMAGVTLKGAVCFISEGFEGNASDAQIFLESGIMDLLEEGDAVMADRGFLVRSELMAKNVELITPPFMTTEHQPFTASEELQAKQIAAARIHVERRIRDIKLWRFLGNVVPQAHIAHVSLAAFVCAYLVNYMQLENL